MIFFGESMEVWGSKRADTWCISKWQWHFSAVILWDHRATGCLYSLQFCNVIQGLLVVRYGFYWFYFNLVPMKQPGVHSNCNPRLAGKKDSWSKSHLWLETRWQGLLCRKQVPSGQSLCSLSRKPPCIYETHLAKEYHQILPFLKLNKWQITGSSSIFVPAWGKGLRRQTPGLG